MEWKTIIRARVQWCWQQWVYKPCHELHQSSPQSLGTALEYPDFWAVGIEQGTQRCELPGHGVSPALKLEQWCGHGQKYKDWTKCNPDLLDGNYTKKGSRACLFSQSSNPGARDGIWRWQGKALNKWKEAHYRQWRWAVDLLDVGCCWWKSLKWRQEEAAQDHVRKICWGLLNR